MKRMLSLMLALCMLTALAGALAEAEPVEAEPEAAVEAAETGEEPLSVTHHTAEVAGQTLSYTATAGRLPVDMQGSRRQTFFTASTPDGVEDVGARPITFALKEIPHNARSPLTGEFQPSAACKFLDLPPVSLRNLQATVN